MKTTLESLRAATIHNSCFRLVFLALASYVLVLSPVGAVELKTKNVFLITTDGLRWQEVFNGAEELLLNKTNGGVHNVESLRKKFWRDTPANRRAVLLPFIWREIATQGQVFGNREKGSDAHITNTRKFSYPGYNEFLTGAADARIDSNKRIPNANTNVFEWLNTRPGLNGRVAAVVNWDVIPWILNTERSRIPSWSGFRLPTNAPAINVSPELEALLSDTTPLWDNIILDAFTARAAVEYVKLQKPRAFYLAFGETDEWAHEGRYDYVLHAAHNVDRFIERLWREVQSMPDYRDKTTFIITTDHGRGDGPENWKHHGEKVEGAENIWIAVIGPDTAPLGERMNCAPVTQNQIAATVAAFLNEDYRAAFPNVAAPIAEVMIRTK